VGGAPERTVNAGLSSAHRSAYGAHRVISPGGVLPQAADRLDTNPKLGPREIRVGVQLLNLDAASFRQLSQQHNNDGDKIRAAVLRIIKERGKMHNPVTGSGGTLLGVIEEIGFETVTSLQIGDNVASLVSLTLTPLAIRDELSCWDGKTAQIPTDGQAIFFAPTNLGELPKDMPAPLALSIFDVCGAPALTRRVVEGVLFHTESPKVVVIGASGKSGALSALAARSSGAAKVVGVVPDEREAQRATSLQVFDDVVIADARDPIMLVKSLGQLFDITIVCVDAAGCEHGSILVTAPEGTVVFFSMATSFTTAALGAEGVAADITMLIGSGFVPGHAEYAVSLVRRSPPLRELLEERLCA